MSRLLSYTPSLGALVVAAVICARTPFAAGQSLDPSPAAHTMEVSTQASEAQFRTQLSELVSRLEKSIELIKGQIASNQSAPFLGDLYLQYAELLSQRANALYYIEMENAKSSAKKGPGKNRFDSVVKAQREAIVVLRNLLRDFPNFDKRKNTLLQLAVSLKSIDELPEFSKICHQIMKEYPGSEEDIKARLYLSETYYDKGMSKEMMKVLEPVLSSKFHYEKNLAKFRIGRTFVKNGKYADALPVFVSIVKDPQLVVSDSPQELSLQNRSVKQDLKREALIETIVPYTAVNIKNAEADAIQFYSGIAPSEVMFQEALEKLSLRYVFLKDYPKAIRLLRALAERMSDTQKVLNIYREVLLSIAPNKRLEVNPAEIDYVLGLFHRWRISMESEKKTRQNALLFFEEQVRELGTRSQDLAQGEQKKLYLKRARDFYELYLGHFEGSPQAGKMAMNLADVYFAQGDFIKSGEMYLKISRGTFGKVSAGISVGLIKNAIVSLQKEKGTSFYEQIRVKGLLMDSLQAMMKADPRARSNPDYLFLLARAKYEQGYFDEGIKDFYALVKRFPSHGRAKDSANIIVDHYNTQSDYVELAKAAEYLQTLKIPDAAFKQNLASIARRAKSQQIEKLVKSEGKFDGFAQAKGYLQTALKLDDDSQKSAALQAALQKSRTEKDEETFFEVVNVMATQEKDPGKRKEILDVQRRERLRLGDYYGIVASEAPSSENLDLALILKDWSLVGAQLGAQSAATQKQKVATLAPVLVSAMDSPIDDSTFEKVVALTDRGAMNDEVLAAMYRNQGRLDSRRREQILKTIEARCPPGSGGTVLPCRWKRFIDMDASRVSLVSSLQRSSANMADLERLGKAFESLAGASAIFDNTGDASLETANRVVNFRLYKEFATFLDRSARANPNLAALLTQKARETHNIAASFLSGCRSFVEKNALWTPTAHYCFDADPNPGVKDLLSTKSVGAYRAPGRDPSAGGDVREARALVFADPGNAESVRGLAQKFYEDGSYSHAAATATVGIGMASGDELRSLEYVLGCSLVEMGLYREAAPYLAGSAGRGNDGKCHAKLLQRIRD